LILGSQTDHKPKLQIRAKNKTTGLGYYYKKSIWAGRFCLVQSSHAIIGLTSCRWGNFNQGRNAVKEFSPVHFVSPQTAKTLGGEEKGRTREGKVLEVLGKTGGLGAGGREGILEGGRASPSLSLQNLFALSTSTQGGN